MKVCSDEVNGRKRIGGVRRIGCERWNESVERHVKEKKELYEKYLQARNRMAYDLYIRDR